MKKKVIASLVSTLIFVLVVGTTPVFSFADSDLGSDSESDLNSDSGFDLGSDSGENLEIAGAELAPLEAGSPITTYADLTAALANPSIDTILLGADIQLDGTLTVTHSPITFRSAAGSAVTLTSAADARHITADAALPDPVLTFANVILQGPGTGGGEGGGIAYWNSGGVLTLNGANIMDCVVGSALGNHGGAVRSAGALTVNSSSITDNSTLYNGGGLYASGGHVSVTDSTVSGNKALGGSSPGVGGGIYSYISASLNGTTSVTHNTSQNKGGGIDVFGDGSATALSVSGTVDISYNTGSEGGGISVENGATAITGNVTVTHNTAVSYGGGGIKCGALSLTGAAVTDNTAIGDGGGGILTTGDAGISNCNISDNTASSNRGGGIYFQGTALTIAKSTLSGNKTLGTAWDFSQGGAIDMYGSNGGQTLTVTGSTFEKNSTVNGRGSAIAINSGSTLLVDGCAFNGNTSEADASASGAISTDRFNWADPDKKTVTIKNSSFTGNKGTRGAAVALYFRVDASIENCTFTGNETIGDDTSSRYGGALYLGGNDGNQFVVKDSEFTGNKVDGGLYQYGGAICYTPADGLNSLLTLSGTLIQGNTAKSGGGVYAYGNTKIDSCVFKGNESIGDDGGGVYFTGVGASNTVSNSTISGNKAGDWGGGIRIGTGVTVTVSKTAITQNTASKGGGIMIYDSDANAQKAQVIFDAASSITKNSATLGGGVYGSAPVIITLNGTSVQDNAATGSDAKGSGGGVYTEDLAKLTANAAKFARNTAPEVYSWDLVDADLAIHTTNILNTSYSSPFKYAYNNADVNYVPTGIKAVFHRNYNASDGVTYNVGPLLPGQTFPALPAAESVQALGWVPSGQSFSGWLDAPAGGFFAAPETMPGGDVHIYANWLAVQHTVTYHANGAIGALPAAPKAYLHAEAVTVLGAGTLQKAGFTFAGWARGTAAGTSATAPDYAPGATFEITEDIHLHALWTPNIYRVTYDANGGTGALPVDTTKYVYKAAATVLENPLPVRDGYTFSGWALTRSGDVITGFAITADTTLYAQWSAVVPEDLGGGTVDDGGDDEGGGDEGGDEGGGDEGGGGGTVTPTVPRVVPGTNNPAAEPEPARAAATEPAASIRTPEPVSTPEPAAEPAEPITPQSEFDAQDQAKIAAQTGNPLTDLLNGNVPLGGPGVTDAWSLLSLILSVIGILSALILFIVALIRRKRYKTADESAQAELAESDGEVREKQRKRAALTTALAIITGILVLVVWLILDDLTLPTTWINKWTPYVAVIFIVHIVCLVARIVFGGRKARTE
ncbi:MAG: InlB B-repeat-containing protein [Clostridiales Family XIII bacterium]|nr:InlB B-repeat-containing protein [Clostridiales Family XIII bacterium]